MRYCFLVIFLVSLSGIAQVTKDSNNIEDRVPRPALKVLQDMAARETGLTEEIEIDLSGLMVSEVIQVVAERHRLNVSVDQDIRNMVTTTFFDVTVMDLFLFLIEKYELEVFESRGILVFRKKVELKTPEIYEPKPIDLNYDPRNRFLSLKVRNDSLSRVTEAITEVTGQNIVLRPEIRDEVVSGYIINRPVENVLSLLATGNGLVLNTNENGTYILAKASETNSQGKQGQGRIKRNTVSGQQIGENLLGDNFISIDENGFLSLSVRDMPLATIIESAAVKSNVNYFLYDNLPQENRTLKVNSITFQELLEHLFHGRPSSYTKDQELFIIGNSATAGIRTSKLLKMQNRTIENVLPSVPSIFTQELEIKEFLELNGLIVTGDPQTIEELRIYLNEIDEVVPLIDIQVMIVQYQDGYDFRSGLELGKDDQERDNRGIIYPQINGTLNREGINGLIDVFNGFGMFNIGKVTEQFYLNLEFLETNSVIKIHSTPRIAALSGHPATLSIGNTDYYFEQNNRILTSNINSDVLQSGTWKPTEANLSVSILPFVSTDENITLEITVEQNSFTGRVAETAPPGKTTQNFQSLVRVRNNEMILLGGLDDLNSENSGTGVPFFSRIPVIRWFVSKRRKARTKSKLHVFIKPTIIY